MKLKELKAGQQFVFAEGYRKNKCPFIVINAYPKLIYKSINGHIEHRPTTITIPNSKVIIVGEPVPDTIRFTDPDGDTITVDAAIESSFVQVSVKYTDPDQKQHVAVSGLSREDTVKLIAFLEAQLQFKQ